MWTVENKWTQNNELKPNFNKVRKELEMDNQLVENFLKEVTIMRNFNHPNVLSLFDVSVHNNKPCALLPLMINGDLKKYLQKHNSVSEKFLL